MGRRWWLDHADEILNGYHDKLGLPPDGTDIVQIRQTVYPDASPIVVRIRLDGYKVEFDHDGTYEIPPHSQWVRQ
jgi:hypothetical protein